MYVPDVELHASTSLQEAADLIQRYSPDVRLLAGGTDILLDLKTGRSQASHLVSINRIKTLRGILPICASCKKIRNDDGYWQQIESYIRDHSDAEFSHGICKECAHKLYPELFES